MVEMGWMGTAIPETHGGAGFGYLELCVLAEELGRSLAPTPFSSTIYLERTEEPEDVAHVAAFLAGPRSGYMTGQALRVDGGLVMH
jgi:NAD(P)-dependent dehydrogenase (short-subunit alcohol dehydrogenase family)